MRTELENFKINYFGFETDPDLNEINSKNWNLFKPKNNVSHVLCGFDPKFNLTKGFNI